ncbi:Pentatricopeptide repeat-containing protein [Platanthera zijinensis]|uniref:Pentatricopeptide repeat-containing protein n=1 Tax=Platanthera zijinensis TaxID=2320716 RepID=A0AAP0BZ34_9ASPA
MLLPHLRLKSSFRPLRPIAVLPHRRLLLSPSPVASKIHLRQPNSISSLSINASPPLLLSEETCLRLISCSKSASPKQSSRVHSPILKLGLAGDLLLCNNLLSLYSKHGQPGSARKVFDEMPVRDIVSWTAIVSSLVQSGDEDEALRLYQRMLLAGAMLDDGVFPNEFTLTMLLSACSNLRSRHGDLVHGHLILLGIELNLAVKTALVVMYSKCGNLVSAVTALRLTSDSDVILWTAIISGFAGARDCTGAVSYFKEMRTGSAIHPNSFTYATLLNASSVGGSPELGRMFHCLAVKAGVQNDASVGNAIVDFYSKWSSQLEDPVRAFEEISSPNVVSWTALIAGLVSHGDDCSAMTALTEMQAVGVKLSSFTLSAILTTAAGLAAAKCGGQLHGHSVVSGLDAFSSVSNSLVDMYGKCGRIDDARVVFVSIQRPNVVSWNSLMSGLASNGCFSDALSTFEDMRIAGVLPDSVTFLIALYACSHGGLIDLGIDYFHSMEERFGLVPTEDHYVCLVDMLGRAGRLEAAAAAIESVGRSPGALVYKTLLGCCRLHGNLVMGEWAASRAMEIHPLDSAVYVLLAGMYDDAGRIELGDQIRRTMKARGATRSPGTSWM